MLNRFRIAMRRLGLWLLFSISIVVVSIICIAFEGSVIFLAVHFGLMKFGVLVPMTLILGTTMLASIVMTLLVAKSFIIPMEKLSKALTEVADGNYDVRLEESKFPISTIIKMNSNFNKMVKELGSTEMFKTDFITNVSHEFKTPLASIEGYAVLLNSSDLTPEQHEYAANILESTKNLTTLTGNILRLSKLENQQFNQEKTLFSLSEQLRQTIVSLESSWSAKNLTVDPDLDEVDYYGNEQLLLQVWINLITNAIKFTPSGGCIGFKLKRIDDSDKSNSAEPCGVYVSVSDNGIGMSAEEQDHIFDKFYQADHNHSGEGNGLGLALVKKIVLLHNGAVTVKSAPDLGSTFTVYLPDERPA